MDYLRNAVAAVIVSIAIIVVASIGARIYQKQSEQKMEIEEKRLLIDAIDQCGQIARIPVGETVDFNVKLYQSCLRDKGYSVIAEQYE